MLVKITTTMQIATHVVKTVDCEHATCITKCHIWGMTYSIQKCNKYHAIGTVPMLQGVIHAFIPSQNTINAIYNIYALDSAIW